MFKKLSNIGDCGIVCDFGDEVDQKINAGVIKLFHHVQQEVLKGNLNGILNYTPSYNKLIINFNLEKITSSKIIDFLKSVDFSKSYSSHLQPLRTSSLFLARSILFV